MTPERNQRIRQLLALRQPDLTVCVEHVHKPHNLSAIVRTCDAVGVHQVHAVWKDQSEELRSRTAMGSQNWVQVLSHNTVDQAINTLKAQGMQILATHLSDQAIDFREIDYTKPTAILLGREKTGISEHALTLADQDIIIPMMGMVQSLNVSVANALIMYEAQRQRQNANMYQGPCKLTSKEQTRILFEGGYPVLAKICHKKGLPTPEISTNGEIIADERWWEKIQMTKEAWQYLND